MSENNDVRKRYTVAKIVLITPKDNYTLYIALSNQHCIVYDMKPQLKTLRFNILQDIHLFKKVSVKYGNTIVWQDGCQLTIDEILNQVKK